MICVRLRRGALVGTARIFAVACAALSPELAAQTNATGIVRGVQAVGSLEGDVYIVFLNGDVKQGAGRTVYLLRDTPEFHTARASFCVRYNLARSEQETTQKAIVNPLLDSSRIAYAEISQALNSGRAPDRSNKFESLSAKLDTLFKEHRRSADSLIAAWRDSSHSLIVSRAIAYTGSGMHAHYRFNNLKPDAYIVYSEWELPGRVHRWQGFTKVKAGDNVHLDLDSDAGVDNLLNCSSG